MTLTTLALAAGCALTEQPSAQSSAGSAHAEARDECRKLTDASAMMECRRRAQLLHTPRGADKGNDKGNDKGK